jgi:hypothetical protein
VNLRLGVLSRQSRAFDSSRVQELQSMPGSQSAQLWIASRVQNAPPARATGAPPFHNLPALRPGFATASLPPGRQSYKIWSSLAPQLPYISFSTFEL